MIIHTLVEGSLDEAVAARIITTCGYTPGVCYGKRGVAYIRQKIAGFNQAAVNVNYLVLIDLMDTGYDCAPDVLSHWVADRQPRFMVRVVAREIESWLLADRDHMAAFLHIDPSRIPVAPEALPDPKRELINLARKSRKGTVKSAIVPESNSTAQVGRLYVSEMMKFASTAWDPQVARTNAPSLDRCLDRLEKLRDISIA